MVWGGGGGAGGKPGGGGGGGGGGWGSHAPCVLRAPRQGCRCKRTYGGLHTTAHSCQATECSQYGCFLSACGPSMLAKKKVRAHWGGGPPGGGGSEAAADSGFLHVF